MAKNTEDRKDWLDAAFDDKDTQNEIDRARRSRNIGCLVGGLVIIVAAVILAVMSCSSLASIMQA